MNTNFSLSSVSLQGWVNSHAVLYKLCVKPFQKFDFELLKKEYQPLILRRFPTVEQFFLEDNTGMIWQLVDKSKGIWVENMEANWYEENGIYIGDLGYAEIKLYGTGPVYQKATDLIN